MDQSLFSDTNSLSPFDRAKIMKLNVSQVPQLDDEESVVCDVDIKPLQITQTSFAMAFANHNMVDPSAPQAKIDLDFTLLNDIGQLTNERAVSVVSLNERHAMIDVGGSLTESWVSISAQLRRDQSLVVLGAFFAFFGTFLIDLVNALGKRYPSV